MGMEYVRLLVKCLGRKKSSNYHAGCRKKQNKKRQATSPLCENSSPDLNTSEKLHNNSGRKKIEKKSKKNLILGETDNIQNCTKKMCVTILI